MTLGRSCFGISRFVVLLVYWNLLAAQAAEPPGASPSPAGSPVPPQRPLVVGVTEAPPFDIRGADGSWSGISVDLWKQIAQEIGLTYEFRDINPSGRFEGLAQGWLDATVGPLTITAQREQICDFTHAYYVSGLGVAVPTNKLTRNGFFDSALLSWDLWRSIGKVVLSLLVALAIVTLFMWLCERRLNADYFGQGDPVRGLGSAFWWAAVTMTTVGYGDVSPRTFKGRTVAIIWMFVSLILVSAFTASMASILTAERLARTVVVRDVDDLRRLRVGTVAVDTTESFLKANRITYQVFPPEQLFEALRLGKVDAIVNDRPLLHYRIQTQHAGEFSVLPLTLDTELYAFAVREGSALREPINRVLLRKIHEQAWHELVTGYLGIGEE